LLGATASSQGNGAPDTRTQGIIELQLMLRYAETVETEAEICTVVQALIYSNLPRLNY